MKGRRGIYRSFQQGYRGRNPQIRSQRLAFGHPGVDSEAIIIGTNSAILDPAFVEATVGHRVLIVEDVIVSHGAILHGCTIRRGPSSSIES